MELLIFIVVLGNLAAMVWLGLRGRVAVAVPLSLPPLLLLWWFLGSTTQPPGMDDPYGDAAKFVLGGLFAFLWIGFAIGLSIRVVSKRRNLPALNQDTH
jgi:hypothetical protein